MSRFSSWRSCLSLARAAKLEGSLDGLRRALGQSEARKKSEDEALEEASRHQRGGERGQEMEKRRGVGGFMALSLISRSGRSTSGRSTSDLKEGHTHTHREREE